jgi:predicted oxidoreductase
MVEQKKIHDQGPSLSRIVAGVWRWQQMTPPQTLSAIGAAVDAGITTFDHADIYGDYRNEQQFGKALALQPALRTRIRIVTKCGIELLSAARPGNRIKHYNTTAAHIIASAENSLAHLGIDCIEVLLLHRPDPLMDADEVCAAFSQLKQQGKVKHFGVSNFSPAGFDLLQSRLPFPLVTNQLELSVFKPGALLDGAIDHLYRLGVGVMAWSPLGGGVLPASKHVSPPMAARYQATYAQLALAWLLRHPANIFPVIGTTQPGRMTEAAAAVNIVLDRQDWFELLRWTTSQDVA